MDLDAPNEATERYKKELLSGFDQEMGIATEIMFGTKMDLTIIDQQFSRFGANGVDIESLLEDNDSSDSDSSDDAYPATPNRMDTSDCDANDSNNDKDYKSNVKTEILDVLQTTGMSRPEVRLEQMNFEHADENRKRTIKEEPYDDRDSNCNLTKRTKPNQTDSTIKVEAPESGRSVEKSEPKDNDFDWTESQWSQYIPVDSENDQSRCIDDDFEWESPQWSQYEPIN